MRCGLLPPTRYDFYPRPPRGGRRSPTVFGWGVFLFLSTPSARRATPMSRSICARRSKFLSTPSARRATLYNHRHAHCCQISIHALREEGDVAGRRGQLLHRISIHALREEGDRRRERRTTRSRDFYPRPPRGGRPAGGPGSFHGRQISIHALREEGDNTLAARSARARYFYPRPPRGGRRGSK